MVDTSCEFDRRPMRRRAWRWLIELILITLVILVLASLSAAPVSASPGDGATTPAPANGSGENIDEPLPGYPYSGEACEESDCGLVVVERPLRCAAYQTASGKRVYGCADPRTFGRKGCYQITFYTRAGKPYSYLDTCSGERPYAPPNPPNGEFYYFEPPPRPEFSGGWDGHRSTQCFSNKKGEWVHPPDGAVDWHCGLEDLPKHWECEVYYDTAYGTVRGCREGIDVHRGDRYCSRPLHLYDEAGREIAAVPSCPRVRTEKCGAGRCGAPVPSDWTCRREHWSFGRLYGGETRTLRRCASPEFYEYINDERPPCKRRNAKLISALYDERGTRLDGMTCLPGGSGGDLGEWAGLEAKQADDTLNETERRAATESPDRGRKPTGQEDSSHRPDAPAEPDPPARKLAGVEAEPEGVGSLALSSGEAEMPARSAGSTPVAASGRLDSQVAGYRPGSSSHPSVDRVPPENREGGSGDDQRAVPLPGHPRYSGASSATGAFAREGKDSPIYGSTPEGPKACLSDPSLATSAASLKRRGARCSTDPLPASGTPLRGSSSGNASIRATEPVGSLFEGRSRVGADASSEIAAPRASAGDWPGRLVPLSGLAALAGIFVIRRRFFA